MDDRVPPPNRTQLRSVDPSTGQPGRVFQTHTRDEALAIIDRAHSAWLAWRRASFAERAKPMKRAAAVLRKRRDELAGLMTEEMGKTVTEARAEIEKCAANCEFFADHAERFLKRRKVDLGGGPKAFTTFNPLGVVLAIMPWNFPFWQVFRFAGPTLMAGNGALLKHASNVSGCALAIEEVFRQAGFPEDLFRTVLVPGGEMQPLIEAPRIAAVTLTGSVEAGRKVAETAGSVLKKTVLELGGSDAYLILDDADPVKAAEVAAAARMVNGGQSCVAGKRFIVASSLRERFERALVDRMDTHAMGDPRDPATRLGPMQSVAARDAVHAQVERSIAGGARLLTGGVVPDRPGAWYPPTVLTDVKPGQPAYDEEVFGPVAAIIEAKDETEAIAIANASEFGLGSGVITRDLKRGERIAAEDLEAGMSFVNAPVRSDSRMPFGGVKHSGYGRECSEFGILEFVNIKSVLVQA